MSELNLKLKPVFIKNKNVRNFSVMMDALSLSEGEGRLASVRGRAGRGKTRTAQWYAAHNDCVYLRVLSIWRASEAGFLQALCRELGVANPPKRKDAAFFTVIDCLMENPRPVFLDEPEKLPASYLHLFRDLTDMTAVPFIMIGEENIESWMKQGRRRVYSRTFQRLEFERIEVSDVILYAKEATEGKVALSPELATMIHRDADGDFRMVKRAMINLVHVLTAKETVKPTEEIVKIAIKMGLRAR